MLQSHSQCYDQREGHCILQGKDYGMAFEESFSSVEGGNILRVITNLEEIIKLHQGKKRLSFSSVISP